MKILEPSQFLAVVYHQVQTALVFIWWSPRILICRHSKVTSKPCTVPLLGQKSFLTQIHTWQTRFRIRWHLPLNKTFWICLLPRTTHNYRWKSPLMVLDILFKVTVWKCFRTIRYWLWRRKDIHQVCQDYDNEVPKSDKCQNRGFLNGIWCDMICIDQWTLIIVENKVCSSFPYCMLSFFIKQMTNATPCLP